MNVIMSLGIAPFSVTVFKYAATMSESIVKTLVNSNVTISQT